MPMQRYKPEQIVTVLRQIEMAMAAAVQSDQAAHRRWFHCWHRTQKKSGM